MSPAPPTGKVAYVLAHGAYAEGDSTFVPAGMKVHLYTDPGETLSVAVGLSVISEGAIDPRRTFASSDAADQKPAYIENLELASLSTEEITWPLVSMGSASPKGDVYILGFDPGSGAPWPNIKKINTRKLCTGDCEVVKSELENPAGEIETEYTVEHTCDGLLALLSDVSELHIVACTAEIPADADEEDARQRPAPRATSLTTNEQHAIDNATAELERAEAALKNTAAAMAEAITSLGDAITNWHRAVEEESPQAPAWKISVDEWKQHIKLLQDSVAALNLRVEEKRKVLDVLMAGNLRRIQTAELQRIVSGLESDRAATLQRIQGYPQAAQAMLAAMMVPRGDEAVPLAEEVGRSWMQMSEMDSVWRGLAVKLPAELGENDTSPWLAWQGWREGRDLTWWDGFLSWSQTKGVEQPGIGTDGVFIVLPIFEKCAELYYHEDRSWFFEESTFEAQAIQAAWAELDTLCQELGRNSYGIQDRYADVVRLEWLWHSYQSFLANQANSEIRRDLVLAYRNSGISEWEAMTDALLPLADESIDDERKEEIRAQVTMALEAREKALTAFWKNEILSALTSYYGTYFIGYLSTLKYQPTG